MNKIIFPKAEQENKLISLDISEVKKKEKIKCNNYR